MIIFQALDNENPLLISGLSGDDIIQGSFLNDTIFGGEGNDALAGLKGDDNIFGGEGEDFLLAGCGNVDSLHGGGGSDVFVFDNTISIYQDAKPLNNTSTEISDQDGVNDTIFLLH